MPLSLEERIFARNALQARLQREIEQLTEECAELSVTVDEAHTTLDQALDALHAATSAFQAAQATLSRLEQDLLNAKAKRLSLTERLASVPVAFDDLPCTLPTEILQAVFVDVIRSHEPSGYLDLEQYSSGRAAAPFTLSAVCSLWRSVAVQTSELWTYVALPTRIEENLEALAIMVDFLLSRSQARVIDVFFDVDDGARARDAWTVVMPPVLGQFARWNRASVRLPLWMERSQYAFLQNPSRSLREICLHWGSNSPWADDSDWRLDCPAALSACSALYSLHVPLVILSSCRFLPGVTSLKIPLGSTDDANVLVEVVCQMPMLQELTLISSDYDSEGATPTPTRTTRLVRLDTLTLSGFSRGAHVLVASLDAPKLRSLILPSELPPSWMANRHEYMSLFQDKFALIERLEFGSATLAGSYIEEWHIDSVLDFSQVAFLNLRHLTLTNCLFDEVHMYHHVVWPNLETITLSGSVLSSDAEFSNIVNFLGWAAGASAEQFRLIVRDMSYIPPWLPTALKRILDPGNCYILDKDRRELVAIDSDDDEASFTDSDACSEDSPQDSSCDSNDADGDLLTVNGPAWTSNDSDDSDYRPLWW